MDGHWFIVASQVNVKIFTQLEDSTDLKWLKTLNNPLGKERSRNLHGKKPGRTMMSSAGGGMHRHTEAARISPHEEAAIQFAKKVGHFLEISKEEGKFKTLTVAAEPHFLGKIKSAMTTALIKTVTTWIDKDLLNVPYLDLPRRLKKQELPLKEIGEVTWS